MPILRFVVPEVRVSKKAWSGVFVIGQVIGRETECRVVHVVVVNLLRVHGTDQIRHLDAVVLLFVGKQTVYFLRLQMAPVGLFALTDNYNRREWEGENGGEHARHTSTAWNIWYVVTLEK